MGILVPEHATRKVDNIGRITLPKGLRDRMSLQVNSKLELFTAKLDGRDCICLAKPLNEEGEIEAAVDFLVSKGFVIDGE